ncbi:MAG: class II aldolase/adducin family protein [bacterium]|nr:class II aldolase/adducin family protein [bacterium]
MINAIVEICEKLDRKGWVANHDGNVTVKYEGSLLATPTAESKADIVSEMVLMLDMEGKKLHGIGKPFSEVKLHLAAYRVRDDLGAVVHAHPPFAMARGLVGGDFEICVPEAVVSIGDVIPVARYAMPGSVENDQVVAEALSRCDVFMMAGNGVLSVGRDVKEAYLRMELLEHLLKIDYYAKSMGQVMTLPAGDKRKLLEKRASIGLGPKGASAPAVSPKQVDQKDLLKDLISEEIKKVLKKE